MIDRKAVGRRTIGWITLVLGGVATGASVIALIGDTGHSIRFHGIEKPPPTNKKQYGMTALSVTQTNPLSEEQKWLDKNLLLAMDGVPRSSVEMLNENTIGDIINELDSFKVTAIDSDTWEVVTTRKQEMKIRPGTDEMQVGIHVQSSTCDLRFRKIPWNLSWVASNYIGMERLEHTVSQMSTRDELVINADPSLLNCRTEETTNGNTEVTANSPELRLVFMNAGEAKEVRDAIISHANALGDR